MRTHRSPLSLLTIGGFIVVVLSIALLTMMMRSPGRERATTARAVTTSPVSSPAPPGAADLRPTPCYTTSPSIDGIYEGMGGEHAFPSGTLWDGAWAVGGNGLAYELYAGSVADNQDLPTRQGFIGVRSLGGPCLIDHAPVVSYDTPTVEGSVWLTALRGDTVTYETSSGNIGSFDYVTGQYGPEHPDPSYSGTPGPPSSIIQR